MRHRSVNSIEAFTLVEPDLEEKQMRYRILMGIALSAFACALSLNVANAKEPIDYQKTADGARWGWRSEMSNPLGCIGQCGDKYDIRLLSTKNDRYSLIITITLGDQQVFSWKGHVHSVFRILEDRLYYAKFNPGSSGGSIVAVDLQTGKQLWESPLKALGPIRHSAYRNLLTLDANHEVVSVDGNESMGKYVEFKDVITGATVGHKIFIGEKPPNKADSDDVK